MTKQTEALKLALEALLSWGKGFPDNWGDLDTEAVTAIKEALAQQSDSVSNEPALDALKWIASHDLSGVDERELALMSYAFVHKARFAVLEATGERA